MSWASIGAGQLAVIASNTASGHAAAAHAEQRDELAAPQVEYQILQVSLVAQRELGAPVP